VYEVEVYMGGRQIMRRRFDRGVTLLSASLLLYSLSTPVQEYAPPFPRDWAKKVQESDRLLIWDVTWEKGKSTGMQEHRLDQVYVTLTEGAVKVTRPDGTWSIEQERPGSVRFVTKGTLDAEEGVSSEPSRAIVFQLKDFVPPKWPVTEGIPGQFPRVGTVKLFETDRIIVWDQTWKAGERIPRHLHYIQAAAVFLEGGMLRTISDQGVPAPPFSRKPGEVTIITSPLKAPHEEEQVKGSPRAIWIEFK
jgi:quercetin dioxygenase-like cupin family protein